MLRYIFGIRMNLFIELSGNISFFKFSLIKFLLHIHIYFSEMSERKMWDEKEDNMIRKIVRENQARSQQEKWKWSEIAQILQKRISGCKRTGKQCRQRWYNHLNPNIIKDKELTKPQIDKLFQLQNKLGNRWANIAKQFPGRTDNNLKNFFYSSLRRAIRQINFFVAHYKKKSNIKPFKQSILTKILNINDEKYRQKLDIKNDDADKLAQIVKQMLSRLSLEQEGQQLHNQDIQFRQKIVKSIQQFNKSCKKRKSKRVQQEQQPDLDELSQYNDYRNSQSGSSAKQSRKKPQPSKQKKSQIKIQQDSSQPRQQPKQKQSRPIKKQQKFTNPYVNTNTNTFSNANTNTRQGQHKPLFQKPRQQYIGQLDEMKKMDSKRSSSKLNSSSSGKNNLFNLESSELLKQSYSQMENALPHMISGMMTRRSSLQVKDPLNFVPILPSKMSKQESRGQGFLFPHTIPENLLLESINFADVGKINEGSVNQSGFLKLSKFDSKTDQNNAN